MMRSLYAGVSGLKTHQTKMDVIGNNISNVNTVAYKSSSVTFSELMYQTTQSASGPNALTGGINARQIGLGVQTGSINTNISAPGSAQTTGDAWDLRITGDAFFIVGNGNSNYFTRAGAFYVDGGGNLAMKSNGYNVMGWGTNPENTAIQQGAVQKLSIMNDKNQTYSADATTKGFIAGLVDKNDPDVSSAAGKIINMTIYDSIGGEYNAKMTMKMLDGDNGEYSMQLLDVTDSNNKSVREKFPNITMGNLQSYATPKALTGDGIGFDGLGGYYFGAPPVAPALASPLADLKLAADGTATPAVMAEITKVAKAFGFNSAREFMDAGVGVGGPPAVNTKVSDLLIAGTLATAITIPAGDTKGTISQTGFTGEKVYYDTGAENGKFLRVGAAPGSNTLTLMMGGHPALRNVVIDMTGSSNQGNGKASTINGKPGSRDSDDGKGRKTGKLKGFSIESNGMIYASYTNGQTKLLGQIAVAEFSNPSGLQKEGENLYSATLNSGDFNGQGVDITHSEGAMTAGQLEMSNVDLSSEFTEMITTQRGFQANSRIITVSDTMIEELVNLKR